MNCAAALRLLKHLYFLFLFSFFGLRKTSLFLLRELQLEAKGLPGPFFYWKRPGNLRLRLSKGESCTKKVYTLRFCPRKKGFALSLEVSCRVRLKR